MSERIIKLQSQQAFNETWKPASETPIGKLIDFTIPANGTYDLGKSYININMETVNAAFAGGADHLGNTAPPGEVASDTALYNNDIVLTQTTTMLVALPLLEMLIYLVKIKVWLNPLDQSINFEVYYGT